MALVFEIDQVLADELEVTLFEHVAVQVLLLELPFALPAGQLGHRSELVEGKRAHPRETTAAYRLQEKRLVAH